MKHFALSILHFFKRPLGRAALALSCVMLVLVGLGVLNSDSFDIIPSAFAAEDSDDILSSLGGVVGKTMSELATIVIKFLGLFVYMALNWIGKLMDNTFIFEGQMGEKLQSVWIIVRNFVNIIFALALVVVALMSVVGYGDESGNYGLKKFIPKMALALIAVNFTFLACRVVLDVNNVLTTAIFSIPQSVTNLSDFTASGGEPIKMYRKYKCLDSDSKKSATEEASKNSTLKDVQASLGGVCYVHPKMVEGTKIGEVDANGQGIIVLGANNFTHKGFVWAMATQFQGLQNLNQVAKLVENKFSGLATTAIFSVIFAVIYGMAYIAMFVVLLARVVVLWLCIMLSPLAALTIVFPDILPDKLNMKTFIDQAFVPAKMAVPLSFGYIMLSQMALSIDTNDPLFQDGLINLSSGELTRGGDIGSIMYGAASVAVVWLGVLAASEGVVGSEFVSSMAEYVKSAGVKVAKSPLYLPVIPTSSGQVSLSTLQYTGKAAVDMYNRAQRQKSEAYAQKVLGGELGGLIKKAEDAMDGLGKGTVSRNTALSAVSKVLSNNLATESDKTNEFNRILKLQSTNRAEFNNIARDVGETPTEFERILKDGTTEERSKIVKKLVDLSKTGDKTGKSKESYQPVELVKFGSKETIEAKNADNYGKKILETTGIIKAEGAATTVKQSDVNIEMVAKVLSDRSIPISQRKAFFTDFQGGLIETLKKSKEFREIFKKDTGNGGLQSGLISVSLGNEKLIKDIFKEAYEGEEGVPDKVKKLGSS